MESPARYRRGKLRDGTQYMDTNDVDKRKRSFDVTRHCWKILLGLIFCGFIVFQRSGDSNAQGSSSLSLRREGQWVCGIVHRVSLTPSKMNDDFCDCLEDGLDEPLTSACSHVIPTIQFTCKQGRQIVLATVVRDGICDCEDCSDEDNLSQ